MLIHDGALCFSFSEDMLINFWSWSDRRRDFFSARIWPQKDLEKCGREVYGDSVGLAMD